LRLACPVCGPAGKIRAGKFPPSRVDFQRDSGSVIAAPTVAV